MQQQQIIPAGYRADANGRLVPESMIKPIDLTRDQLVSELARKALDMSNLIAQFKAGVFADINAFVDLSGEQYGVALGGKKGNLSLYTYDGRFKVQVAVAEHLVFDERLQAAKHLIDECIVAWSADSRDEIKVLVQSAFDTDKEGKINTGRVLGLRRLDIKDEKWQRAMNAIGESLQVVGSKSYVRFYERVGEDEYKPIRLDIAAV
jgi:hypothetical protein